MRDEKTNENVLHGVFPSRERLLLNDANIVKHYDQIQTLILNTTHTFYVCVSEFVKNEWIKGVFYFMDISIIIPVKERGEIF